MRKRVAVERTISAIGDHLAEQGFEVDWIDTGVLQAKDLANYGAIIISGQDSNLLGREDIGTEAPVISAEGKTPAEIAEMVRERLELTS
ncbi:MAG: YkuS family protein [Thermanaeromonas sp.]|uniref:YkuS family protein n=1 Tax=Thermanaeromonas sp. TaxID=2003697 RepID=UPI002440DBC9|nr:YkuS family protein [Thermanaeromonas sp.]MCG0278448.1 YkuS family protein [Thermanaeromonas sp.]